MIAGSPARAAWGLWLGASVLAVAACVAPAGGRDLAEAPQPAERPATRVERLAVALVEAREAFERNDRAQLAIALRRIDSLGGTPDGDGAAELERWRQAVGPQAPMRGRTLGPGYRSGRIPAGQSQRFEQQFLSGKRASIALSAPGNARLTLHVEDRREQPVCAAARNPQHCQWVPVFTDRYSIRIGNPGETTAQYFLVIE